MTVCWKTRLGKSLLSLCQCIPCCSEPTVDENLEEEFQSACSTLFEVHFFSTVEIGNKELSGCPKIVP